MERIARIWKENEMKRIIMRMRWRGRKGQASKNENQMDMVPWRGQRSENEKVGRVLR